MDGEEVVNKSLEGLGSLKDLAGSDHFIFALAIIGCIVLVIKWLKGRLEDQVAIDTEVRRQNAEITDRLDELGYDENGMDLFRQYDSENEEASVIAERRNAGDGRNERIRTGRVSSRHYTGNI